MGQQQILLIVLSVILVGIAVSVGITMFKAQAEQSHIDMIIQDLNNVAMQALQYFIRPVSMGGGGNSFVNFETFFDNLPTGFRENDVAVYSVEVIQIDTPNDAVKIEAQSKTYNESPTSQEPLKRWMIINRQGELTLYNEEPII